MPRRRAKKMTRTARSLQAIPTAVSSKPTAGHKQGEKVVKSDYYYCGNGKSGAILATNPEREQSGLRRGLATTLLGGSIAAIGYFYVKRHFCDVFREGPTMRKKARVADACAATVEEDDDKDDAFVMVGEVRDVSTQSQCTYKRKLLQPKFQLAHGFDGAYPDVAQCKTSRFNKHRKE